MDKENQEQPKQYILLDSNIVQYAADKFASVEIVPYLQELMNRGFGLAISDITIYELLKGANVKKENEMLQTLNLFQTYFVTQQVLLAAARLETIYKIEGILPNQIEEGDKFIAATSILTGSLIITANIRDFPWPYFQEVERKIAVYSEKRKRSKCVMLAILNPDIQMVNQRFSERPV